jgi:hypothetical protein
VGAGQYQPAFVPECMESFQVSWAGSQAFFKAVFNILSDDGV